MTQYAAFFRGVNVGAKNRIRMTDLTRLLEGLGYVRVRTYIQSGNAVFDAECAAGEIVLVVDAAFYARFGFNGGVKLRTADELRAMTAALPVAPDKLRAAQALLPDVRHLYVYLLDAAPATDGIEAFPNAARGEDAVLAAGNQLIAFFASGIRASPLAARIASAYPSATARNRETLLRVLALMD